MQISRTNYKQGDNSPKIEKGAVSFLQADVVSDGPSLVESLISRVVGPSKPVETSSPVPASSKPEVQESRRNIMDILEGDKLPNTAIMDMKEELSFALTQFKDYQDQKAPTIEVFPAARDDIWEVQKALADMEAAIAAFVANDVAADELSVTMDNEEEARTRSERLLRDLRRTRPIYKPQRAFDEEPPERSKELIQRVEDRMRKMALYPRPAADSLNSSRSNHIPALPVSRLRGIAETMDFNVPESLESSEAGSVFNSAREHTRKVPTLHEQSLMLASSAESSEIHSMRPDWADFQAKALRHPNDVGPLHLDVREQCESEPISSALESDLSSDVWNISPGRTAVMPAGSERLSESDAGREESTDSLPSVALNSSSAKSDDMSQKLVVPRVARRKMGNFTIKSPSTDSPIPKSS